MLKICFANSLLNCLVKEERAIVTEVAGTTRDTIEEFITIRGVPLKIVDTAGIRETTDTIERIGLSISSLMAFITLSFILLNIHKLF